MAEEAQTKRVYLRIKRKRDEGALENVVIEGSHIRKKQNVSIRDIGKQLESTDLNASTAVVFRRFDTVDGYGKGVSTQTCTSEKVAAVQMKGVLETNTKGEFCYIDLHCNLRVRLLVDNFCFIYKLC